MSTSKLKNKFLLSINILTKQKQDSTHLENLESPRKRKRNENVLEKS